MSESIPRHQNQMSEQFPLHDQAPTEHAHEAAVPQAEYMSSRDIVAEVTRRGVGIQDLEQLATNVGTLRATYELQDDVLVEPRNRLLLTAIATKVASEPLDTETSEGQYVTDMMALSFGDYTNLANTLVRDEEDRGVSEETVREAYEHLTDEELSGELRSYLEQDPAFVSLRERLGVTGENEAPFSVRALRVSDQNMLYGWEPRMTEGDAKLKAWEWHQKKRELGQELVESGKELSRTTGSPLLPAWVRIAHDGTKTLCMPLPAAEKIVRGNTSERYRDEDLDRDKAILQHEYTHTQRMVSRAGRIGLGSALEELRAEHFSGNKQGYTDTKRYFRAVSVIRGYSVEGAFEPDGAPYDGDEFEYTIAREGGLDGYLDAMTLVPPSYIHEGASALLKDMNETDGGIDGHFSAAYDRAVAADGEDVVLARVDTHIARIREVLKDKQLTPEAFFSYANPKLYRHMLIERFREQYPQESDGHDYFKTS